MRALLAENKLRFARRGTTMVPCHRVLDNFVCKRQIAIKTEKSLVQTILSHNYGFLLDKCSIVWDDANQSGTVPSPGYIPSGTRVTTV